MTTIRIPPEISDEALAAAMATLGLVLVVTEAGQEIGEPIYNARRVSASAVIARCATPGCARTPVVRLGKYTYCATHGRRAMEERT